MKTQRLPVRMAILLMALGVLPFIALATLYGLQTNGIYLFESFVPSDFLRVLFDIYSFGILAFVMGVHFAWWLLQGIQQQRPYACLSAMVLTNGCFLLSLCLLLLKSSWFYGFQIIAFMIGCLFDYLLLVNGDTGKPISATSPNFSHNSDKLIQFACGRVIVVGLVCIAHIIMWHI